VSKSLKNKSRRTKNRFSRKGGKRRRNGGGDDENVVKGEMLLTKTALLDMYNENIEKLNDKIKKLNNKPLNEKNKIKEREYIKRIQDNIERKNKLKALHDDDSGFDDDDDDDFFGKPGNVSNVNGKFNITPSGPNHLVIQNHMPDNETPLEGLAKTYHNLTKHMIPKK
jgi:hypothetical protein